MEKSTKKLLLFYLAAAALGAALHFLFTWLPNPITALVAPVRESVRPKQGKVAQRYIRPHALPHRGQPCR